jgi:hypothetical protein
MFQARPIILSFLFCAFVSCVGMTIPKPDPAVNNAVSLYLKTENDYTYRPVDINEISCRRVGGSDQEIIKLTRKMRSNYFFAFNVKPGEYIIDHGITTDFDFDNDEERHFYYRFNDDIQGKGHFKVYLNRYTYAGSFVIEPLIEGKRSVKSDIIDSILLNKHFDVIYFLKLFDNSATEKKRFFNQSKKYSNIDKWIPLINSELELLEQPLSATEK